MARRLFKYTKYLAGFTVATAGVTSSAYYGYTQYVMTLQTLQNNPLFAADPVSLEHRPKGPLPTRDDNIAALQNEEYDVLVIGGGATGCGVALDSVSRGLKTALVEMDDFASGTSSRSTKLIHGGVRYLQKAILKLDSEQYNMVEEALHERANLLRVAPHLAYPLPIMLPVYKWWQVPYYWVGIKAYDLVAGRQLVKPSYYLTKRKALEEFPMLRKDNLCGAIVYYDGGHNDSRMCLAVALTAARAGANVLNHCQVTDLLKTEENIARGAYVRDVLTGKEWAVKAKCVINATGPLTDSVRRMDDPHCNKICQPSAGVHLVLPDYYSPASMGLLDPATSDGRVIFFLPWEGYSIAGTTDRPCKPVHNPQPTEEDIQFILKEIKNYLSPDIEVRRGDVMAAWCGIRPLVADPASASTQNIARNHVVNVSPSRVVTIAGGKWTTYRSMAVDTMDAAVAACDLPVTGPSRTDGMILEGGHSWYPTLFIRLVQDFGLETEVAKHLSHTYGDRSFSVAKLANITGKRWPVLGTRLHEELPFIEAEVRYACRREYACKAVDVISRRLPLSMVNIHATTEALPRIIAIMAEELKWDKSRQKKEMDEATDFIQHDMGSALGKTSRNVPINFSREEINKHIADFNRLDVEKKGYITVNDLRRMFKISQEFVSEDQLRDMLTEVDLNRNGEIDMGEYLELMSALRTGAIANSRFALATKMSAEKSGDVERSGGGL